MDTKNKPQKIGEHGANLALAQRVANNGWTVGRNFHVVAKKPQQKNKVSFFAKR